MPCGTHVGVCDARKELGQRSRKVCKAISQKPCAFIVPDHFLYDAEVDTTCRKSKWDEETQCQRRWRMEGEVSDGRAGNEVREKEKEVNETL